MTAEFAPRANPEADLYGLLGELLSFPDAQLAARVESELVRQTIGHLAAHLPGEMALPLEGLGATGLSAGELESEYIRLFDAPDKAPTPLYTGVYAARRRDAMEELLRSYRYFGVTVNGDAHDLPDFVPTVLEFLQFLSAGAAIAMANAREPRERAMADILERHLCPWASQTASRLEKREANAFYRSLIETILAVGTARLQQLRKTYPAVAAAAGRPAHAPVR